MQVGGKGKKEMRSQTGSFQVILFRILCLFPESINTIQNNVKMATIFSPLFPPPGDSTLGHLTQGFSPPDLVQQMRLSDNYRPLESFSKEFGWGGKSLWDLEVN